MLESGELDQLVLLSFTFFDDVDVSLPPEQQKLVDDGEPVQVVFAVNSKSIARPGGLIYDLFTDLGLEIETFTMVISEPGQDLPEDPIKSCIFVANWDLVSQGWECISQDMDGFVKQWFEVWPSELGVSVCEFAYNSIVGEELSQDQWDAFKELYPNQSFVRF